MKILLSLLLAAGISGLVLCLSDEPLTAVGLFNFGFYTALAAWTLAQYESRRRRVWSPQPTAAKAKP